MRIGACIPLIPLLLFSVKMLEGCKPVSGYEEQFDVAVLAYIDFFDVPDSSSQANIRVRLKATIGESSAFSFDRINYARTDTLFRIAVWGRQAEKAGVNYEARHVSVDTTLVLTSPRAGLHYIEVVAGQGILRDSTVVY